MIAEGSSVYDFSEGFKLITDRTVTLRFSFELIIIQTDEEEPSIHDFIGLGGSNSSPVTFKTWDFYVYNCLCLSFLICKEGTSYHTAVEKT